MHKIEFKTGPDGFRSELVCPEDCTEQDVHQDQYAEYGPELIPGVEDDTVLCTMEVEPKWDGGDEEAELWLIPIVPED